MKKLYIFIAIVLILFGIGLGFYFYKSKTNNSNSNNSKLNDFPYNSTRVLANDNSQSSDNQPSGSPQNQNSNNNTSNNTESTNNTSSGNSDSPSKPAEEPAKPQNTETQIADFTTKIYTKESDRQNNISITCSTLNDTIVENGGTFSFCNTVGKATTDKGYKKADVFIDGKKIEALGRWKLPSKLYVI